MDALGQVGALAEAGEGADLGVGAHHGVLDDAVGSYQHASGQGGVADHGALADAAAFADGDRALKPDAGFQQNIHAEEHPRTDQGAVRMEVGDAFGHPVPLDPSLGGGLQLGLVQAGVHARQFLWGADLHGHGQLLGHGGDGIGEVVLLLGVLVP